MTKIGQTIKSQTPIDKQIADIVKEYENNIKKINQELESLPEMVRSFDNDKQKYLFLGELKAKIALYSSASNEKRPNYEADIAQMEKNIENITIENTDEKKSLTIKCLEETILEYMKKAGKALMNYADYQPVFDYTHKKLLLRKPKTTYTEHVGSSSNHMFLHLFLFQGLHAVLTQNKSPFVPSFLIIDQPSRPYYEDGTKKKENIEHSDEFKITSAFQLLNDFITYRSQEQQPFQMIVFEHIPKRIWQDANMDNVHLVEEFVDGNALIPKAMLITLENQDRANRYIANLLKLIDMFMSVIREHGEQINDREQVQTTSVTKKISYDILSLEDTEIPFSVNRFVGALNAIDIELNSQIIHADLNKFEIVTSKGILKDIMLTNDIIIDKDKFYIYEPISLGNMLEIDSAKDKEAKLMELSKKIILKIFTAVFDGEK